MMQNKTEFEILSIHQYYSYTCFVCNEASTQLAHIIGATNLNRKLYGKRIIDHELNVLPACSLKHNDMIDIGRNSVIAKQIVSIIDTLDDLSDKREAINSLVIGNIKAHQSKSVPMA